jgi:RimJ/RimL family protein N-acetyltransferase
MFTFRPMESADKPSVVSMSSRIWDGDDYLPYVFDDWVKDREGLFEAVLEEGRLVGCGKLSFLTPTDAWLEGLRKDPASGVTGVGAAVGRRFLSVLAGRRGITSVRFSTYVENAASISLFERLGFRRILALSNKVWDGARGAPPAPAAGAVRITRDREAVERFVERSGYFQATGGLMCEGWRAYPYIPELFFRRYVERGACRTVVGGGRVRGLAAWVRDTRLPYPHCKVVFLDGEDEQTRDALLADLISSLGEERRQVEVMLPRIPRLRGWFADRGFASWKHEDDFLVYDLPLEELARFSAGQS